MAVWNHEEVPDAARLLNPSLFAHGRLLRRYEGSDAFRFSARSAFTILDHVEVGPGARPQVLWDPFSGTGLIACVALFAFRRKFDIVIASDVDPLAVTCSRKNVRMFTEPDGFEQRLQEIRRRQKSNAKEHKRWGDVARYLDSIRPTVRENSPPETRAFVASALSLPSGVPGQVHFVADLPYGHMCQLRGGVLPNVIPAILRVYPDANITFVLPRAAIGDAGALSPRPIRLRTLKKGRMILCV